MNTNSTGGGSVGGGASNGSGGASGGNGTGGTSAGTGGGETGGAGGASGGSGGNPATCDVPYNGPVGGPRSDGPEATYTTCDLIEDEFILARYEDPAQKVPQGLYFEPPGVLSRWEEPCSESLDETLERASEWVGEVEGQMTSDWSHEVSGCYDAGGSSTPDSRRIYNNLSCDYFDGTMLDGDGAENLAYLVSLLWWMDNGNLGGSQILGYSATIGDATDLVHLCTIHTTFGDFGLCDEITLESTTHRIMVGGQVMLGEPTVVRTIQGNCN